MKIRFAAIALMALLGIHAADAADPPKVGYIYVGPKSDYGYNYAQDQGRQYVEKTEPVAKVRAQINPHLT
jgi:simple sugar transport system substrate-binding protein